IPGSSLRQNRMILVFAAASRSPNFSRRSPIVVEAFLDDFNGSANASSIARGRCSERLAGSEAYLPLLDALDNLLHGDNTGLMPPMMKLLAPSWYAQIAPASAETPPIELK